MPKAKLDTEKLEDPTSIDPFTIIELFIWSVDDGSPRHHLPHLPDPFIAQFIAERLKRYLEAEGRLSMEEAFGIQTRTLEASKKRTGSVATRRWAMDRRLARALDAVARIVVLEKLPSKVAIDRVTREDKTLSVSVVERAFKATGAALKRIYEVKKNKKTITKK